MVDAYIAEHRATARQEMRHFAKQKTLAQAVEWAALSKRPDGKRHEHQYRIPGAVLARAAKRLARADYAAVADFDGLHGLVTRTIRPIKGIGPLAVYDIAHRIGAYLGYAPRQVYLHRGTLAGARALGLTGKVIPVSALPKAFRRLSPAEIEDCLCIYKADLKRLAAR